MDADLLGALHTYLDGVKIADNELALDAVGEVGPGNHFFGCAHTMANYETAPLDEAKDEALQDFVARKKAAMDNAWY